MIILNLTLFDHGEFPGRLINVEIRLGINLVNIFTERF